MFLTPWSALVAAAAAIPLLALLYMLKLRRRQLRMPSTMLWRKSFEDLQANAPFQKLRWSWLLLLQLLAMLAVLAALAQPLIKGTSGRAARLVVLVDRSASMNALLPRESPDQPPRTRLDAAKDAANALIDTLDDRGPAARMMIIAVGATPQVVTSFEADARLLREAAASIEPTDELANLDEALRVAGAFAGTSEETDDRAPEVIMLSDGNVNGQSDKAGFALSAGAFTFTQVAPRAAPPDPSDTSDTSDTPDTPQPPNPPGAAGSQIDNIGIASFSVRRDEDDPAQVRVFARLVNAGSKPVALVATLAADDRVVASIRKTVPPASEKGPGEEVLSHALELPGGAVLSLRQNHADQLAADDAAWAVLPPPGRPRIALVHPSTDKADGDSFLTDVLQAMEPQSLRPIGFDDWQAFEAQGIDPAALFDLIVFDRVSPSKLPAIPSITIGGAPTPLRAAHPASAPAGTSPAVADLRGQRMLSWDRQHPIMRNVSLDDLVFAGFDAYELPQNAVPLAFGPRGPVIAAFRDHGVRHVAVGFELTKSNWPLQVGLTIFIQNVLDNLAMAATGRDGQSHAPGEPVTVRPLAQSRELEIDGPERMRIAVEPGASVTLPPLHRAGLYTVKGAAPPEDRLAVNVGSDVESDIRPRDSITVNARPAAALRQVDPASRPLWPWLAAAALGLLVLEWLAYCLRARGG